MQSAKYTNSMKRTLFLILSYSQNMKIVCRDSVPTTFCLSLNCDKKTYNVGYHNQMHSAHDWFSRWYWIDGMVDVDPTIEANVKQMWTIEIVQFATHKIALLINGANTPYTHSTDACMNNNKFGWKYILSKHNRRLIFETYRSISDIHMYIYDVMCFHWT